MSVDWVQVATEHWMRQPSPRAPNLTNSEFTQAVKMATAIKFGGHASPLEASAFWSEFKGMNARLELAGKDPISPDEFSHVVDNLSKISFTFHGRPPTMNEIAKHRDSEPAAVSKYFADLPDELYPHVTAGQMVSALQKAQPWALQFLGRKPNKLEAAYIHHSGENPAEYYGRLGAEQRDLRPNPHGQMGGAATPWGEPPSRREGDQPNQGERPEGGGQAGGGVTRERGPMIPWGEPSPTAPPSEGGGGDTVVSE